MIDLGYWYCCAKCGHGYGWKGKYTDMPPCPKCGDRPDTAILHRLQAFHELLAQRDSEGQGPQPPAPDGGPDPD